jgi:hypothetical protein
MANAVDPCDLDALHQAITNTIAAAFPDLKTVEFYRLDREELPLPACLLDLVEMEHDHFDPGSEQAQLLVRFEARFVLGFRKQSAKLEVRKLAAAFAALLRKTLRWPGVKGQGAIRLIGCFPDDFEPVLDQFEVWRVEWQQPLWFGESVWKDIGTTPSTVFLGIAPEIGIPHVDDYVQVAP